MFCCGDPDFFHASDPEGASLRLLHWNVCGSGLTETPASLGFHPEFEEDFSALLQVLHRDKEGEAFWGFSKARDYTQLPPIREIRSLFFSFIDLVYSLLYHPLGGEVRLGTSSPGDEPDLANTLRCLFLRTTLMDNSKPPSSSNHWTVPQFEREMELLPATEDVRRQLRRMKENAFSPSGSLTWERSDVDQKVWKRQDNIWSKWSSSVEIFKRQEGVTEKKTDDALTRFITFGYEEEAFTGGLKRSASRKLTNIRKGVSMVVSSMISARISQPRSLVSVVQDNKGDIIRIQSLTLHSAMHWLLIAMCRHSIDNAAAELAIRSFAGVPAVPKDAEARAGIIFPRVLQAVELWLTEATLTARHAKFCRKVKDVMPQLITAVEYDGQWRLLPLPAERYRAVWGAGTAVVFFDSEEFEWLEEFQGVPVRPSVDAIEVDSWVKLGTMMSVTPKSSCVALLRRRNDASLFIVIAVHLESAPPSNTYGARLRAEQLRALLRHLSSLVQRLRAAGQGCTVLVGGDFNTLQEEFVYGTTEDFWQCEGVRAVQPPLRRPKVEPAPAPEPPVARFDDAGRVHLLCEVADGGDLRQASHHEGMRCTRAGSSMVIDFVFAGSASADAGKGKESKEFRALKVSTSEEMDMAARADSGIFHAVKDLGSDHLPVGCEIPN
ncbi:unnamed protein product [Prorocentrum cordatum]|uniref:Nocturnin n=1 Tax=Prorocentrum cordatum TaxID=2364126 RepID=A0ABN9X6R0_9DINO|nr:unnamed protein product [Polarella glacialis]